MSDNYHDPWINGVTGYTETDMNVPLSQLDEAVTSLATSIYDIGGSYEDTLSSLQILLRYPVPRAIAFPIELVLSQMVAGIAATSEAIFSIQKNNIEFGTATFLSGGTVANFAGTASTFVVGDVLSIVAPASPDDTLENIGWALVASRTVLTPI